MLNYPGEQPHNYGKIHHAIHKKIQDFDWAIFNSYVTNYQAGYLFFLVRFTFFTGFPRARWKCTLSLDPSVGHPGPDVGIVADPVISRAENLRA